MKEDWECKDSIYTEIKGGTKTVPHRLKTEIDSTYKNHKNYIINSLNNDPSKEHSRDSLRNKITPIKQQY